MTKLALELAKARREFDLFFEEDIKKIFQKNRKRIYLLYACYLYAIILLPATIYILINISKTTSFIFLYIPFWLIFITLIIPIFYGNMIYDKIKFQTLSSAINSFSNLRFLQNAHNNENFDFSIEKSQLFEKFDTREDEYNIVGHYNDVEFKMSRTSFTKLRKPDKFSYLDLCFPKELNLTKNENTYNGILLEFRTGNNYPFTTAKRNGECSPIVLIFISFLVLILSLLILLIPTIGCLYLIFFSIIITLELKIVFTLILFMSLYFLFSHIRINQIICNCINSIQKELTIYKKSANEKKEKSDYTISGCEKNITPEFLNILDNFKKSFNSERIDYSFYDNTVIFAITGDGIEPVMPHDLFKKKTYEPFFKTIETIYTAADYFGGMKD